MGATIWLTRLPKLINMKTFYFLLCGLLIQATYAGDYNVSHNTDDPVVMTRKIIKEEPQPWNQETKSNVFSAYSALSKIETNDDKYLLLESPALAFDYFQGGNNLLGDNISKGLLLEILNQAINSPETVTSRLARATINRGLSEYEQAYKIADKFRQVDELSISESLQFLENRYGYAKLDHAKKLLDSHSVTNISAVEKKNKQKVMAKLREIEKKYPDQIEWIDALALLEEWYRLLEEAQVGLAIYKPYVSFKRSMDQLNQSRINERISFRSGIKITYPDPSTVWTQPGPVDIKWESSNISAENPIRFFLVKDDMVVQDLGTFKNTEYKDGITLRKGLPAGSNYRVMGIEQLPANKYHVAKFATPFFTIEKAPRKPSNKPIAVKPEKTGPVKTLENAVVSAPEAQPVRQMFAGRTISYVKELEVDSDQIEIILWDHGRQDGDIVSIYLNGTEVIKKHHLTYREVVYEVKLDAEQKNDLFLYAHNLGKFPPNTVSIKIKDQSSTEEIVLNSDLKSCESVLINVSQ